MKKDFLLFAGLALGGFALWSYLKTRPKSGGTVGTTGTARTDPGVLTAFAQLFGKQGTSSIASRDSGAGSAASISAAVGPLAKLAGDALARLFGAGDNSNKPLRPDKNYAATPLDAYTQANAYEAANRYAPNEAYTGGGSGSGDDTIAASYRQALGDSYDSEGGVQSYNDFDQFEADFG